MSLEEPATEVLPASREAAAVVAPAEPGALVGRTLGKFELVEQLGRGGAGDVFLAQQPQLGRSAVVKVLRRDLGSTGTRVERFLREARLASRLDHPYAAHIYAFGAEPDGTLWIAMEHVRGATLDELLSRRGAMPPAIFAPLFGRLCEVLHTAHELGIVHRDIKGSNVMVIERAGQLLPKLIDLGIAKAADVVEPVLGPEPTRVSTVTRLPTANPLDTRELTQHGATLGSPHYMAPEQWEDASEVDARADIYALGALAYRCLAGRLPFRYTDRKQLAAAHLSEAPPALPDSVLPSLGDAVLRALEKAPAARWQTALAFGEAVRFAVGAAAPEAVPIFDPYTRDVWLRAGPQPIADAVARLAAAGTTVEADAAVRELVAITCRWLAVVALATLPTSSSPAVPAVRDRARGVVGRDDAEPWLELARSAVAAATEAGAEGLPGLTGALAGSDALAALASRLDERDRPRTKATLAADVEAAAEALRPLEPLLAYQLVVGGAGAAESWQGPRRRDREPIVVWGEPLAQHEVALLDATGRVVARLSPLAQVIAPLPSAEPELFLLWRSGRGTARLVAAPWGFERDDDAAGERLAALTTEDSDTAHDAADDVSPYPGLAAYGPADAERFVGREREVEALANRLVRAPLLAVLGPSGAGKSSFIHAGVLPRLAEHYRVVTLRPGRHPMHALAALPEVGLHTEQGTLVARLRELGESAPRGLVVVIDQLEELVTLCADPAERAAFAATLAAAADAPSAPVRVIVTLRDDFAAVIESEAAFRGRFEVFVLGTPLPEALRRIVIEPARRAAVAVDPAVVDDMVAEVAGRPASLPLLSFTAAQLWASRDRATRRITRAAYLALGGVAGALSTYADQIYDSLAHKDQDIVRTLFARLVAGDGTRIPAPRRELEQLPGAPAVLAHLVDARLLVVREDDRGTDIVEIVHECLAERWDRLARWRREDATDRALVGDLRAAARRWQDTGRRPDGLWRGEALAELRRLLAKGIALTDAERLFAAASDLAARRARRVRRGAVAAVIIVLVAVAAVMAALGAAARTSAEQALASETNARQAAGLAEDRLTASLVAQGVRELNDGRELHALVYLADALERGADSPAMRFMISVAKRSWRDEIGHVDNIVAITSAGDEIVGVDTEGTVRWWDRTGAQVAQLEPHVGRMLLLSRARDRVLVGIADKAIVVLDGHQLAHVVPVPATPLAVALGPNPDEVIEIAREGLRVRDLGGRVLRQIDMPMEPGPIVTFDASGRHALFGSHHEVIVYDLVTLARTRVAEHITGDLMPSDDLTRFGYVGHDRALHVIAGDGHELRKIDLHDTAYSVIFSQTGDRVGALGEHTFTVFGAEPKPAFTVTLDPDTGLPILDGEDVWLAAPNGHVKHYAFGELAASWEVSTATITALAHAGDVLAVSATDNRLTFVRASAAQLVADHQPCELSSFGNNGIAVGYQCGEMVHLYVGRQDVAVVPNEANVFELAREPVSGCVAVSSTGGMRVFDSAGKPLAATTARLGSLAFLDADHLIVSTPKDGLWRWTLPTGGAPEVWTHLGDAGGVEALAAAPGGVLGGTHGGELRRLGADGQVTARLPVGGPVVAISVSPDGRWAAAQLTAGAVAIVDLATFTVTRTLEPGDVGATPTFDASGELILRVAHEALGVWERSTGRPLVVNLDLLRNAMQGHFLPDGRIEVNGVFTGLLDLPIDRRPPGEIVREIRCRVPLAVGKAGELEPAAPSCP